MKSPGDRPGDRAEARLASLATADAVRAEAMRIYGSELRSTGVVHVTAVWQRAGGLLVTLRSGTRAGDDAPRVAHDAFALGLARARADALLTTGEILRREPDLRHDLPGPGALPRGLADWRRSVLGKPKPPILWVMTRSGDLDFGHPAFGHTGRSVVYGPRSAIWPLESRAADAGIELVAADAPSARDAVARLRREFGAATVVVEAGPSVARGLYEGSETELERGTGLGAGWPNDTAPWPSDGVDELMLTVLHSEGLETRFRGPTFLARSDIEAVLGRPTSTHRLRASTSASGDWELARYVRG